jgi:hypothetical protein
MRPGNVAALAAMTLVAVAALTTAGCGTTVVSSATSAQQPARPGQPSPTGAVSAPSLTPRQRAEDDATGILKLFAVPPGARQVQSAPLVSGGVLKQPIQTPGTPDLVDRAAWLIAPGSPSSVLGWEEGHVPHEFTLNGSATSDGPPGIEPTQSDMFSLPPVAGVLDSRQLIVEVVRDGSGTAIRVDAQVTWLPARPASERVPAAAKAVTIAMDIGMNQGSKKPPKPVTITDEATVRKLVALINSLPLPSPGIRHCPADFGDSLTLIFRASREGPPLAVATVALSGCQGVALTIGGKPQPGLQGGIGPRVIHIAALPWKIPTL